jgi:histidyl-tRNA synthetase
LSDSKIKAPRGTFDVLGEQASARTALEARARSILEGAGYERIETPAFEATELFARGVGESTDIVRKEMFTFDDGAGRSMTLRPEGTAPVCRAYVEHGMHKRRQPVKLWYLSSFFRHERAQAGRYRQFWQVGAEALGSEDPAVDAESIALLATLLGEMGVADLRLRLSSLGSGESRSEYRERLQAHLRAHEESLSDDVRSRIELNPLRAFDSEHPGTRAVMQSAPRLLEHLSDDDAAHFAAVRALLDAANVAYEVDSTLVRGIDYYTRTVFEFTSDALGAQSGVGGGGRYDGLVQQLGGPATPGMGWAAGIERILLAGERSEIDATPSASAPVELFVAIDDHGQDARSAVFRLVSEARSAGLTAQMDLGGRSLKGQLGHANALGARFVAIVGGEDPERHADRRPAASKHGFGRACRASRPARSVSHDRRSPRARFIRV